MHGRRASDSGPSRTAGRRRLTPSTPGTPRLFPLGAALGCPGEARLGTFVVVNPAAGAGGAGRRWEGIARALRAAVGPFEHALTAGPGHATALVRAALARGAETVVVVGGDGTVNEAAAAFFEGRRPVAPDATLGVIPAGTGSDLARALGLGSTLEAACARLAGPRARTIDVGHARFVGRDGAAGERIFLNVASFGVGGAVAATTRERVARRLGGALAYSLATAVALARQPEYAVTLTVDEGPPEALTVNNVAVCNGPYFGAGIRVAPQAAPDDGRLEVTIWAGFGLRDFLLKRRTLYDGTHVREPGTRCLRATRVVAAGPRPVPFELDGEPVGRLPVTIEILPAALRVKA